MVRQASRRDPWTAGRRRSAVTFLVLVAALNGIYQLEKRAGGHVIDLPFSRAVTAAAGWLGQGLLPIPVERHGDVILGSGGTAVVVRSGCSGIEAVFLLLAGVLAVPGTWRQRGAALLVYLPLLLGLNLLRILLLLYVMARHPQHIDFIHYQVGQGAMALVVLVLWVHHVRRVGPRVA